MSEKSSVSYSVAPGLGTLLGVLFITLKLTHVIAWPWIWVLAPFWISFLITILIVLGVIGVALLAALLGVHRAQRAKNKLNAQIESIRAARKNSSY